MMLKRIKRIPLVIIIGTSIFSLILSVTLYKLFCRLDQVIDCNAANAIASIAMAILTFLAVVVALYLPRKERLFSSKVGLFDKRFEAYYLLYDFYWNTIVTGKPSTEDENNFYKKANSRLRFLIDPEDWKKIQHIGGKIFNRIDYRIPSNPNDFEQELNELRMIFNKYLSFHDVDI